MMGYHPIAIPTPFPRTNVPAVQQRLLELQEARKEANAAHDLARAHMAARIRSNYVPFQKGDKVWLDSHNLKMNYPSRKIAPRKEGPFEIKEVLGPVTYRLKLPPKWKIHSVIHAALLSPFKENNVYGKNFTQPPPDLVDGQEEYEIEAIIRHRNQGKGYAYLVKWKNYPTSENTWEPERNLNNARTILAKYKKTARI